MPVILTTRRRFLFGLGAAGAAIIAAPSLVRARSLMPVSVKALESDSIILVNEPGFKPPPLTDQEIWDWFQNLARAAAVRRGQYNEDGPVWARWGEREAMFLPPEPVPEPTKTRMWEMSGAQYAPGRFMIRES